MQSSLLILGAGPIAERLIEEIEALDALHFTVLGVVDNQPPDRRSPIADRWPPSAVRSIKIITSAELRE